MLSRPAAGPADFVRAAAAEAALPDAGSEDLLGLLTARISAREVLEELVLVHVARFQVQEQLVFDRQGRVHQDLRAVADAVLHEEVAVDVHGVPRGRSRLGPPVVAAVPVRRGRRVGPARRGRGRAAREGQARRLGRRGGRHGAPLEQLLAEVIRLISQQDLGSLDLPQVEALRLGLAGRREDGVAVRRDVRAEILGVIDNPLEHLLLLRLERERRDLLVPADQRLQRGARCVSWYLDPPVADRACVLIILLDLAASYFQALAVVPRRAAGGRRRRGGAGKGGGPG